MPHKALLRTLSFRMFASAVDARVIRRPRAEAARLQCRPRVLWRRVQSRPGACRTVAKSGYPRCEGSTSAPARPAR